MNERGERGPHGDHGQQGEKGERGRTGRMPRRIARSFLIIALLVSAVLGVEGYFVNETRKLSRQNRALLVEVAKTHEVQCQQRSDLDQRLASEWRRIKATRELLIEHKGKALIFAIPRELIEQGQQRAHTELRQSKASRQNLSILDCKETP